MRPASGDQFRLANWRSFARMAALATSRISGNAPIVRFDLEDLGLGMPGGKFEDVLEIRATPGVDALRVVTDDHDVAVASGDRIDQFRLDAIGVLILIDQDMLELLLIEFAATSSAVWKSSRVFDRRSSKSIALASFLRAS